MSELRETVRLFQDDYEIITENINELIIIINQRNEIEYVNKLPLMKFLEYENDDMIGKSLLNYVSDVDLENFINALENCTKGITITPEIRLKHKNGYFKCFRSRCSIIDKYNMPDKILIVLEDITEDLEQKKRGEQVKELSEKYRLILENTNDIIILYNENLEIEYVNENVLKRLLGYSFEDITQKNSIEIIHPEDKEKTLESFKKAFQTGEAIGETRIRCKTGGYKLLESKGKVFMKNGEKKLILVSRDITEKKEAEQKLKESEKEYRLLAENLNDMIVVINENNQIEYINEKTHKKIMGYSAQELIGKNVFELLHPDDKEQVMLDFREAIKTGEGIIEARVLHKNGKYLWTETNGKTFLNESGNLKLLTISRDITERKLTEKKIKESEERLKHLLSTSPTVIYTANVSEDFEFTYLSENVRGMTGYDPDDFFKYPKFWESNIHPEDREAVLSKFNQLSKLENFGIEYRFNCKDGLYHWIRHDIKLISSEGKVPAEIIGSCIDITMNKKTEEKVQYQAKLVDDISDAIISTDLNFNIISWNKAAELIYGWKSEEVIMRNIRDIFPNVEPYNKVDSLLEVLLKEGIWKGEATHSRKDGTKLNLLSSISIIKDITGMPIGAVSINHDITDVKMAEEKIRDSEVRYRNLFENSPVALMEQDYSELKIYIEEIESSGVNDFEVYFENNPKEIQKCMSKVKMIDANKKILEVYNVNEKENFILRMNQYSQGLIKMTEEVLLDNKQELLALIRGKTTYESEITTKTLKGDPIYLYAKKSIVPGFEDTWQKLILSIVDITNLKKTQEELRESELKFRTIAEQSALGVIIQQDGLIKFANPAVAEMSEYPLHIISNWTVEDAFKLVYQEDLEFVRKKFNERKDGDFLIVNQYEFRIITRSEKLKWIDIYTKPIIFKGRPALLCTFMDITIKKQIEEELKEVSRLKSELLSRTSHELKTPLVSIKGYADLLLNQHYEELDFYTISILHEIKQGCSRLESLIEDLLETSKLESGEIKLNKIEDDLSFLIRFCVKDLKGLVETRNHNLILDIKEKMITYFEKERIYEVIINLLSNAIKYSPPNGIITIRSKVKKGYYVVSIRDTGIGLTNEEKGKIFKKFGKVERYGQGLDVDSEGSGLGLYISKKIIELHDGNIWVKSKGRKKGSTFYFSLPIIRN
ncbi:MAG: PAS domain S-box protein [Promethearchaeota archaeon]